MVGWSSVSCGFRVRKHEQQEDTFCGLLFADEQRLKAEVSFDIRPPTILQCVLLSWGNCGGVFSCKVSLTVVFCHSPLYMFVCFFSCFFSSLSLLLLWVFSNLSPVFFFFPPCPSLLPLPSPHWVYMCVCVCVRLCGVIRDMHAEIISSIKNLQLDGEDPRKLLQSWGRLRFPRHVLQ